MHYLADICIVVISEAVTPINVQVLVCDFPRGGVDASLVMLSINSYSKASCPCVIDVVSIEPCVRSIVDSDIFYLCSA